MWNLFNTAIIFSNDGIFLLQILHFKLPLMSDTEIIKNLELMQDKALLQNEIK